jgi:hypothetical protein
VGPVRALGTHREYWGRVALTRIGRKIFVRAKVRGEIINRSGFRRGTFNQSRVEKEIFDQNGVGRGIFVRSGVGRGIFKHIVNRVCFVSLSHFYISMYTLDTLDVSTVQLNRIYYMI